MKVVFVTHNELGRACLEKLATLGANVQAVYTRPQTDHVSDQTDLTGFTAGNSTELHRVDSVNDDRVKEQIQEYAPEFLFVVGWSRLVDEDVLDIPSEAALGMHPAPLPRGRGRAPIAWSLIKGLNETALSFFHLTEEADAGALVGQEPIPISIEDDAKSVYERVVAAGEVLIGRYFEALDAGKTPRNEQDESRATWWPKREPQQGLIDWNRSPMEVYNWIRGQTRPYPGAFSYIDGRKVTIWAANPPSEGPRFVKPGEIVYRDGDSLGVGAWEGILEIEEIQVLDSPAPASALLTEHGFQIGDVFLSAREKLTG